MENQNQTPTGWKDIQVTLEMPLPVLVNFLNVLNQRLCTIEDTVTVTNLVNGKPQSLTLTDLYRLQAEAEIAAQAQKAADAADKPEQPDESKGA